MEEKEIKYIPYGTDEIDYNQFITNAANEVQNYVNSQSWSNKRKESFLNAYQNLISQGITGASNDTGIWRINHSGDIPLETLSKRDREMYGEAAYFLRQQMSRITPRKKEEEKKKEDLDKFDFLDSFHKQLLEPYSGNPNLFADQEQGWDSQDKRQSNGLRLTTERRKSMQNALRNYLKNLDEKEYNFEESPFKDKEDVKNKIQKAIDALDTESEEDDLPAFNALGLKYRTYFSNGGNDVYGTTSDGKQVTYQQYYENQQKEAQEKAKTEAEAKKQAAYNNTLFFNRVTNSKMLGQNPQSLKQKYGTSQQLRQALYQYSQGDIRSLTPDQLSEIQGAYRYLAKNPIDNKLLKQLQSSSSGRYAGAASNRFRKINGIDNLIWDNLAGQVIQINNRQQQQAIQSQPDDLFKGVQSQQDKEKEYLNSKIPGITNAEWKELSAIGLDIASIINPEAVTGSLMSLGAADLRRRAKNDSNPNWDLGDYFWQGVDYLTGALGGLQVAGDLVLGAKTMATASKAIPILRKMARVGAWADMYHLYPALEATTNKLLNGEELNVEDWRNIGQGIRGLVSHGRLNRGNRAERRVLEKSGQNVTPENISSLRGKVQNYSQKLGFTRTKPTNTSEVSIIKATVNGKESEIEISPNAKARIQEKVQKAGNSAEARNKAVKEVLESEGKVKASDKIEVETPSSILDGKFRPNWIGTSRNLFGTKQVNSQQGNDVFNDYISGNRSYWDRYKYGSNAELKGIYNRLNISNNQVSKPSEEGTPKTTETKSNWSQEKIDKYQKNLEQMENSFLNRSKYNPSSKSQKKIDLSKNVSPEKYSLADGKQLELSINDGILNIKGPDGINISQRISDQLQIKKVVSDIIKNYNNSIGRSSATIKRFSKEYIESLKELRRKGYLFKQGGTIENLDTEIKEILKTL